MVRFAFFTSVALASWVQIDLRGHLGFRIGPKSNDRYLYKGKAQREIADTRHTEEKAM